MYSCGNSYTSYQAYIYTCMSVCVCKKQINKIFLQSTYKTFCIKLCFKMMIARMNIRFFNRYARLRISQGFGGIFRSYG